VAEPRRRPSHHRPGGGFRNPWPGEDGAREGGAFLRWQVQRLRDGVPPDPTSDELPRVPNEVAYPTAPPGEIRATWVGHSTFLVQLGGWNVLTDPVWSRRASPVPWAGPARLAPPGVDFDALPAIDVVVLSHDHYDHLDKPTVERIHQRFGDTLRWVTPMGYTGWFEDFGITTVVELDWWERASLAAHADQRERLDRGPDVVDLGQDRVLERSQLEITAAPARHWTRRSPFSDMDRLWASFALRASDGAAVYFAGDSGFFEGYGEVGERLGPFDLSLIPIGAYEPRWFMQAAHMNPEEAVRTYIELGARGDFGGMHWGTFRLTDEAPLEPPVRTRTAWREAGLDEVRLWIPRHGETRIVRAGSGQRVADADVASNPSHAAPADPSALPMASPSSMRPDSGEDPPDSRENQSDP
jgi:N-acyl-phosphatidylethanolamine-hydrolysing phospholipase D